MIRFTQFSLARGVKPLFENTTFTLNPGEKAGLIGANGAGKSTLFAVLRGLLHADGGDVFVPPSWRAAHVAQETPASAATALEYTLDGDVELRAIEARIAAADAAGDGDAHAHAFGDLADADGYTAASRAEALLAGLGFSLAETQRPVASFSGGWRMRLNLAQALMRRSDLLLLDEPTNHLDLDAIVWLEDWLRQYSGTLIVISHDREFLDAVCNVTLHLENRQVRRYGGNYSQFEILRAQQITLQQSAYEKQQKTVAHLQSFVDRFKAKASKARQAQSRVKALERMELIAPVYEASPFTFVFREPDNAPNPMLVMEDVQCGYVTEAADQPTEHLVIVDGVTLSIQIGQRIGLLGANGQGKSTLVKTLAGELAPLAGVTQAGKGLRIGYFAQHQLETLRDDDSPLMHLGRIAGGAREQEMRNFLGSFNFRGDMASAPIAPFSGGEKARLALALIVWQKPNLLLLDEPTNHLDLETRHALTSALAQFEGTLIIVSHDRHLLRATTDEFMLVADHRLTPFDGDLDDYRIWLLERASARRAALKTGGAAPAVAAAVSPVVQMAATGTASASNGASSTAPANPSKNSSKSATAGSRGAPSSANAGQRRPLQKRVGELEKQLEALTTEKAQLDAFVADQTNYAPAQKAALADALKRHADVAQRLSLVETDWMEAQDALERIG